jgi:hypothetical protein
MHGSLTTTFNRWASLACVRQPVGGMRRLGALSLSAQQRGNDAADERGQHNNAGVQTLIRSHLKLEQFLEIFSPVANIGPIFC